MKKHEIILPKEMTILKNMDALADFWYEKTGDKWWLELALTIERRYKPVELRNKRYAKN